MMQFAIVDCGIGNLRSVQKIFERLGATAKIAASPDALASVDGLVLPGVGAFKDAIAQLDASGLAAALKREVVERNKPLLGICLGMQLLALDSEEGGRYQGLGLIPAVVRQLDVTDKIDWAGRKLTLPHIGWNAIATRPESILFQGVASGSDVYFVHSYHVVTEDRSIAAATSEYGYPFVAAIETGKVFATQFHPEKSQELGQRIIRNFVEYCGGLAETA